MTEPMAQVHRSYNYSMSAPRTPPAFIPTLKPLHEGEASGLKTAPLVIDLPLLEDEVLPPEAQLGRAPSAALRPTVDINLQAPVLAPSAAAAATAPAQAIPAPTPAFGFDWGSARAIPPQPIRPHPLPSQQPASSALAQPRQGLDDSASQAERMRSRLLQRVDVIVQRRVREAAAAIALEHAQNLLQELRPALEKAITESVNEALALEVAARSASQSA